MEKVSPDGTNSGERRRSPILAQAMGAGPVPGQEAEGTGLGDRGRGIGHVC